MIATRSTQLAQAREMVESGISVIPIGPNKVPAIAWKAYQQRLPTDAELAAWFASPDQQGIGIVCGAVSGNLEVIDFDIRHLPDLVAFYEAFCLNVMDRLGDDFFDRVAKIETPGPGLQFAYRSEVPIGGSQKLARHNGTWNAATGRFENPGYFIETRGEGGYALTYGSPGFCHPSGRQYRHLHGSKLHQLPKITGEEREVLWIEAKALGVEGPPAQEAHKASVSVPSSLPRETAPGNDFAGRVPWRDILEPHGFKFAGTEGEATYWQRPGSQNKHSASTNHQGSGLFYAWSPNCHPAIEPQRGYSKFAVYAALNFGDLSGESFRLAAKQLSHDGYGGLPDLSHVDVEGAIAGGEATHRDPFCFQTYSEFMALDQPTEFLIKDILAAGQPGLMAGPEKSLKTGLTMAMAFSASTGTDFLGHFHVPRPVRVGVMTGEAGTEKLQRVLRAQESACNLPVCEPQLFITQKLPVLSDESHLEHLRRVIDEKRLELLFVDPVYLCLGAYSDKTASVAVMGKMLRDFESIGRDTGCTLILNHHTNRKHEPYKPLGLRDISGAGFPEWMRQWFLVCPRKDFDPATYQHSLWAVVGGSAGHAGRYAIDVRERDDSGQWAWVTDVRTMGDEVRDYKAAKEQAKEDQHAEKAAEFASNLRAALESGKNAGGSTINDLKEWFRANGSEGATKISTARLEEFEESGLAVRGESIRGNNQTVQTWLPSGIWLESSERPAVMTA